jgi:hypothetical protein
VAVRIWTATYLNSWTILVLGFEYLSENSMLDEKESEFDEEDERNAGSRGTPVQRVDVWGVLSFFVFPSDGRFMEQLMYVPFDFVAAIRTRAAEAESESESETESGAGAVGEIAANRRWLITGK